MARGERAAVPLLEALLRAPGYAVGVRQSATGRLLRDAGEGPGGPLGKRLLEPLAQGLPGALWQLDKGGGDSSENFGRFARDLKAVQALSSI